MDEGPEDMTDDSMELEAIIPFLILVLWSSKFFIFLFGLNKRSLTLSTFFPSDFLKDSDFLKYFYLNLLIYIYQF